MKIIVIFLVVFFELALAQNTNTTCDNGYWGPDCMNLCGECYISKPTNVKCDPANGNCLENGCLGGYSGEKCDQAVCKGGCGSGVCVAPDYCGLCGEISRVSPNCEDIRLRGLLGSLMAFAVISGSITLCGIGSVWYKRRKSSQVAL